MSFFFADDGAIWKRGRKLSYIFRKTQDGISNVERWANRWGFKFSVDKTKVLIFTKWKTEFD